MASGGLTGRVAINPYFRGSHFHHLNFENDPDVGVYIPLKMHRTINHNSKTGKGFDEINTAAYEWIAHTYKINNIGSSRVPTYEDFMALRKTISDLIDLKYINGFGETDCEINDQKYHIHVKFNQSEAVELVNARDLTGLNWTNFILVKSGVITRNEIKSNKRGNTSKSVNNKRMVNISVSYLDGIKLQEALEKSGKSSWKSYILYIAGIEKTPQVEKIYYTAKQMKEIEFQKKMDKANVHHLKCFSCKNGNYWWCKLFGVNIIDMAHNKINFENCTGYKEKISIPARFQTPRLEINTKATGIIT